MENEKKSPTLMLKIASFVVDKRMLFFLIYILLIIFSLFSRNWVTVQNDISAYLGAETETRQGLDLMDEQFVTFGTAKIMVSSIPFDDASALAEDLRAMKGVSTVEFVDEDEVQSEFVKHYNNGAALFNITFVYPEDDDRALDALERVKERLSNYDLYISTTLGDQQAETIATEMMTIILMVAVVVGVVLLLTCQSFGEIPVLAITFVVSMILNSGTNFLFGTISFVSNSVSSILQLALSVDYAIILCNRYKEERQTLDVRDAAVVALTKAIPEISSSSLTTISGLFALVFMEFKIGADMGVVLIKAIVISLLSVFTLMPGLLVLFSGLMERTKHKDLSPKIGFAGRFAYATRRVVPILFLALFAVSFYFSQQCPYVYGYSTLTTPQLNESQIADNMIRDTFGKDNFAALVVPGHDFAAEEDLIRTLEARNEVHHIQGLANQTALGGYMLTDALTARDFSELIGMDFEVAELLYSAYAASQDEYGRIIGGIATYRITLMDMLMFLYEKVEEGYVELDEATHAELRDAYTQISDGRKQLEGTDYDRILIYLNLPEESDETFAFLRELHVIARDYYDDEPVYVVGESTSQMDLRSSFERDNIIVSIVSAIFVLVILLFTFHSAGMPLLLIVVIEGAIFLNFSFPTILRQNLFFMSYLIVSSIQMGANIDYAIVISSRYVELRKERDRKTSIIEALNFAFPTIVTSGTMMTLSGFLIGRFTSEPSINGIGMCLGRGTLISIVLVMFVLPQILLVGDKFIQITTFDIYRPVQQREEEGDIVINGAIRGTIHGTVIGHMNAVVRGSVQAVVASGTMDTVSGDVIRLIEDRTAGLSAETEGGRVR